MISSPLATIFFVRAPTTFLDEDHRLRAEQRARAVMNAAGINTQALADLFRLDLATGRWTPLRNATNAPAARSFPGFAAVDDGGGGGAGAAPGDVLLFLYGGSSAAGGGPGGAPGGSPGGQLSVLAPSFNQPRAPSPFVLFAHSNPADLCYASGRYQGDV